MGQNILILEYIMLVNKANGLEPAIVPAPRHPYREYEGRGHEWEKDVSVSVSSFPKGAGGDGGHIHAQREVIDELCDVLRGVVHAQEAILA